MSPFADLFLEAMRYEQWLRFYFLEDAPQAGSLAAVIVLPEDALARTRREEPQFAELREGLLGQEVAMERSRDLMFRYLGGRTGMEPGSAAFAEALAALGSDAAFRRRLDLFQGWVQELADGDTEIGSAGDGGENAAPSFRAWEAAFRAWAEQQPELAPVPPSDGASPRA